MSKCNQIIGILNVTPDSFSDGGLYSLHTAAIEQALKLIEDGADILDIGAESTRPGSEPVTEAEEWTRLEPVLKALSQMGLSHRISVDTYKPKTMLKAADYGVGWINDVSGGVDDETLRRLQPTGVTYIAMHCHGQPKVMQKAPLSGQEALMELDLFYQKVLSRFTEIGFGEGRLWLDPGVGFGKDDAANLLILQQAMALTQRFPIVLGVSRKSFIGRLLDIPDPLDRDKPSKMIELGFLLHGVQAVRTHDVASLKRLRDFLQ